MHRVIIWALEAQGSGEAGKVGVSTGGSFWNTHLNPWWFMFVSVCAIHTL